MATLCYAAGGAVGGAALGLVLSLPAALLRWLLNAGEAEWMALTGTTLCAVAFVSGLWDLGVIRRGLPGPTHQLPRHFLSVLGPYRTGFLWGLYIGLFRRTRTGFALYYTLLLWTMVCGNPLIGAGILGLYGLSHGLVTTLEVAAIAFGADPMAGLLGDRRNSYFFRLSGTLLIACSVLLLVHGGLTAGLLR